MTAAGAVCQGGWSSAFRPSCLLFLRGVCCRWSVCCGRCSVKLTSWQIFQMKPHKTTLLFSCKPSFTYFNVIPYCTVLQVLKDQLLSFKDLQTFFTALYIKDETPSLSCIHNMIRITHSKKWLLISLLLAFGITVEPFSKQSTALTLFKVLL